MTVPEKRVLPFRVCTDGDMGACVEDAHGRLVAAFGYHPDGQMATDEAEQVVRCVNAHEALVESLKKFIHATEVLECDCNICHETCDAHADWCIVGPARAALQQAGEEL